MRHGTRVERDGDLPVRWIDRRGTVALEARWHTRALVEAALRIPDGRVVRLRPRAGHHALFGACDQVEVGDAPLGLVASVDWAAPERIPPLDRPGALPSGAGTAILGFLASRAADAGSRPLRYRGPYPTGALFDSLLECFRVAGDPAAAFARFIEGVEQSTLSGEERTPEVDFEPAPFERVWLDGGICVQLRDGLEKAFLDGRGYARDLAGTRRLRPDGDGWAAVIELRDRPWATVARFAADGELREGPLPTPPLPVAPGRPLPEAVRPALLAALPPRAPHLLRPDLQQLLAEVELVWGDSGAEAAMASGERIIVHAAHVELFAADPMALLDAIAVAVEPVAERLAQRRLAARITARDAGDV